jgi:hypothetical protein
VRSAGSAPLLSRADKGFSDCGGGVSNFGNYPIFGNLGNLADHGDFLVSFVVKSLAFFSDPRKSAVKLLVSRSRRYRR